MNTTNIGLSNPQIGQPSAYPSQLGQKSVLPAPTSAYQSKNAYSMSSGVASGTGSSTAATVNVQRTGNYPEKKFRAGGVSATIWVNKGHAQTGADTEYKTVSLERSYTDKEGKWQSTSTLRVNDVPKAAAALQKAYEYLVLQEQDLFKGGR